MIAHMQAVMVDAPAGPPSPGTGYPGSLPSLCDDKMDAHPASQAYMSRLGELGLLNYYVVSNIRPTK